MYNAIFEYEHLRMFFNAAVGYGPVQSFEQASKEHGITLRHDVDVHVKPAYEMSRLEKDCGVTSTYFFLTTANTYNLNSTRDRILIREMADDGFEIGLHFDPTIYGDISLEELQEKAEAEAALIELVSEKKVRSISLHNPSIHGQYPQFNGFINAYAPEYFQPENYMSDSRMSFRDKIPLEFIKKAASQRLQVLLHPILYLEKGTYCDLMRELVYDYAAALDYTVSLNPKYKEEMQGRSLEEFISHHD